MNGVISYFIISRKFKGLGRGNLHKYQLAGFVIFLSILFFVCGIAASLLI